eukprot:gnl/MRDRNA2_/MRDRNA2_81974_c0_seq1.p1 gnl/MRDRNA2_/MRDRNA2_81974_c0~~gnl/MRDRNA2_/MRDRNA2_81974_c0_seq1.p1  ORF type:complete len:662 (+),score=177.61 gnl/MRDRNA2_/MRDRNA2_81974_c0_seq1:249-1988(+)
MAAALAGGVASERTDDSSLRSDAAGALAKGIRDELNVWKAKKQQELNQLCETKLKVWNNLVKSEEEEYENESRIWELHRRRLLRELDYASKDCQRGFRKRMARAERTQDSKPDQRDIINEAVRSLEAICEDLTGKLERRKVDPPSLLQHTLDRITKIIEDKRVRTPRWKMQCAEIIGARCKEILAELQTQMEERRVLYAKVYNQRKHALQWLAKALSHRKASLLDMEEWYTWGYTQIFNFDELAKAAEDAERFDEMLESLNADLEPWDRSPDMEEALIRQNLLKLGEERIVAWRAELKEELSKPRPPPEPEPEDGDKQEQDRSKEEKDSKGNESHSLSKDKPSATLHEVEAWLLAKQIKLRKQLMEKIHGLGGPLTKQLNAICSKAGDSLQEHERQMPYWAEALEQAHSIALQEHIDWIEERFHHAMNHSLREIVNARNVMEHALRKRMRELRGGCYGMAVETLAQAQAQSLTEVTNATIHLLTHSNNVRPEHVRERPPDPATSSSQRLTELWDTLNVPWEERMGFALKMLDSLPQGEADDGSDGRFTAGAGALVVTQELQDLREQLVTMPGGQLCVAT